MSLLNIVGFLIGSIIFGFYIFVQWRYSYWKRKKIPYIIPKFPFGTFENPFSKSKFNGLLLQEQYNYFKSHGYIHGGLFSLLQPVHLLVTLDIIKSVMSESFQHFTDRNSYVNKIKDPLSANLLNLRGSEWKNVRTKLTPAFTVSKMKMMFPTIVACGEQLLNSMNEICTKGRPLEVKYILDCFTIDVIGSCAFGVECNSFKEDSDFRKIVTTVMQPPSKFNSLLIMFLAENQKIGQFLGLSLSRPKLFNFFSNLVKDTIEYRKKNSFKRNDFMQILIELNECDENKNSNFTIAELTAHAFLFFIAGFETSSSTMSFCLYELARNLDMQEKVRNEVVKVIHNCNGGITYDGLNEAKYLNQVIDETLRMYPPAHTLNRRCVSDYKLTNNTVTIEKGMSVRIPVYSLHYDPEYFPNPEKFDPERFSDENKSNIRPFSYLPFGEGPRNCIGSRFAKIQTKIGLALLLKHFKFTLNKRTDVPLEMNPLGMLLSPKSGIWLDISRIE